MGDGAQVILFGYAGDETGKTKVRSLMIGLDAGSEIAILYELRLGRESGHNLSNERFRREDRC